MANNKKKEYEQKKQKKRELKQQEAKKRKMKKVAIWGSTVVVIFASLWGIVQLAKQQATPPEDLKIANEITADDHVAGNREADVVLVEYGDFECPACASYEPMLHQLRDEYSDSIAFVFRHFPLRQIHRNAQLASQAAEAAANQGKFWEMHDLLFETQRDWASERNPEDKFVKYAESLELDVEQFRNDLNSLQVEERVNRDYDSGFNSDVNGTPTFFLNGDLMTNPTSYDDLKANIDAALGQ